MSIENFRAATKQRIQQNTFRGRRPIVPNNPDALLCQDPLQQYQLATTQQAAQESQLAQQNQRKTRFGLGGKAKRGGSRWGAVEDKPYKPLPYIDLPIGLSDREVDLFLREQRLEDLTEKIRRGVMEDVEPDIRAPSPPPVYDRNGTRLNTRETRIKKAMLNEQNRLVRFMLKHVQGYLPPVDYRPQKLAKKLILPLEKWPNAPFVAVILGARGANHKRLQEVTGCRIAIRGKGIDDKWQTGEEAELPQHVHVEADNEDQIEMADKVLIPLLDPESPEFEAARNEGLMYLAKISGYDSISIGTQKRCQNCGGTGHYSNECPELNGPLNYRMANVVCAICGDRSHPTIDCPHKGKADAYCPDIGVAGSDENWKENAGKRMDADNAFADFMKTNLNGKDDGHQLGGKGLGFNSRGGNDNSSGTGGYVPKATAKSASQIGVQQGGASSGPIIGHESQGGIIPGGGAIPGMSGDVINSTYGVDSSVKIPDDLCGFFVGKNGCQINQLKERTQCDINLDSFADESGLKKIIIKGTAENRALAIQLCTAAIADANQRRINTRGIPGILPPQPRGGMRHAPYQTQGSVPMGAIYQGMGGTLLGSTPYINTLGNQNTAQFGVAAKVNENFNNSQGVFQGNAPHLGNKEYGGMPNQNPLLHQQQGGGQQDHGQQMMQQGYQPQPNQSHLGMANMMNPNTANPLVGGNPVTANTNFGRWQNPGGGQGGMW